MHPASSCQDPPQDQRLAGWGQHQGYWDDVERVFFHNLHMLERDTHTCIYCHLMLSVTILGDLCYSLFVCLFVQVLFVLLCLKGFLFSIALFDIWLDNTRGLVLMQDLVLCWPGSCNSPAGC